jgi:hypothetical protein
MKSERELTRREMREKMLQERSGGESSFYRGRTISGYQKEQSELSKNRKLVIRRRKLGAFFLGLAIFSILVFVFLLQFIAKIAVSSDISSKKNFKKYEKSVEKYLDANPSERFSLNLNKSALLESIQKENPEVFGILSVELAGIASYNFKLSFRKPVASWWVDGREFFVDSEGASFTENMFSENPKLSIIDDSGAMVSSGKNVAGSSFFSFVGKLVSSANSQGLEIIKIRIPPLSLRQIEVSVKGVKYFAKMSTVGSAEGQVYNFKAAINYFSVHKKTPSYIDLRVEGKGYYRQ